MYIYTATRSDDYEFFSGSLLVSSSTFSASITVRLSRPFLSQHLPHTSTILDYTLDIIFYFPRTHHRASLFFFLLFIITVRGFIVSRSRLLFPLDSFPPNGEKTSTLVDESLTIFSLAESIRRTRDDVFFEGPKNEGQFYVRIDSSFPFFGGKMCSSFDGLAKEQDFPRDRVEGKKKGTLSDETTAEEERGDRGSGDSSQA